MRNLHVMQLNDIEIEIVYYLGMKYDFPDNERKPLSMIHAALNRGEYLCLGLFESRSIRGYAFFVQLGTEYLLDYFAVVRKYRDMGCGSTFLQLLREQLPQNAAVIIEAENPAFAADAPERETRERRLRFYLRNGCIETGVTACVFGVEYLLLELPVSQTHSSDDIRAIYARLYQSFLPAGVYRKFVSMR